MQNITEYMCKLKYCSKYYHKATATMQCINNIKTRGRENKRHVDT